MIVRPHKGVERRLAEQVREVGLCSTCLFNALALIDRHLRVFDHRLKDAPPIGGDAKEVVRKDQVGDLPAPVRPDDALTRGARDQAPPRAVGLAAASDLLPAAIERNLG
jgi:hypothetical protein